MEIPQAVGSKEPNKAKSGQWGRAGLSGAQVGVGGSEGPAGSSGMRSLECDYESGFLFVRRRESTSEDTTG